MPFNADLRAGYFNIDFNMSWFYEYLSEMNEEIEFIQDYSRIDFEHYIEKSFEELVVWRLFQHKQRQDEDYEDWENDCFGFLRDRAAYYIQNNANYVKWTDTSEDESNAPNETA
ncbi:MAG: hypothetical protein EBU90_21750 [Proteobacteria bacterium]|nr:hypothetical protein [Pseudomonadota bacterium]